jgi:E217 collar protein gp28
MTTLNLHGIVRGAITSVLSDIPILYTPSAGRTVQPGGKVVPQYGTPIQLNGQVQPVSMDELQHYDFVQAQGVYRRVYVFGQQNAIDRIYQLGGDLLSFPEIPGGPNRTWLIKAVEEQFPGWCSVIAVGQLDPKNPKNP